jgi:DNA-binding MarR family transcriptional regulator
MNGHDDKLTNKELALITEYVKWSVDMYDDVHHIVYVNKDIRKSIMEALDITDDTLTHYTKRLIKRGVLTKVMDKQFKLDIMYVCKELWMIMQESKHKEVPYFVTYAFAV